MEVKEKSRVSPSHRVCGGCCPPLGTACTALGTASGFFLPSQQEWELLVSAGIENSPGHCRSPWGMLWRDYPYPEPPPTVPADSTDSARADLFLSLLGKGQTERFIQGQEVYPRESRYPDAHAQTTSGGVILLQTHPAAPHSGKSQREPLLSASSQSGDSGGSFWT